MLRHLMPNIVLGALLLPAAASSHPIVVDGSPGEWLTSPPTNLDAGHLGRVGSVGEYTWRDRTGDERTDLANPDPSADLVTFQVTADPTGLSCLAMFSDITVASGDGAPMLQIAVDRTPGAGTTGLSAQSETQVSAEAAWERLIVTRFGSGNSAPAVLDETFTPVGTAPLEALNTSFNTIELWVPWADLGGVPTAPIHFTVAVFKSNALDETADIGGAEVSDALDAVTNYANPGAVLNTLDEVSDLVVNYHFEIWFHLDPDFDPLSPILLSEIYYDTPGIDTHEEWVEIYNAAGANLSLENWRIGDEESIDGTEGMFRFPAGAAVTSNDVSVVALQSSGFQALNGGILPDFEVTNSVLFVPDMVAETLWASGPMEMGNFGDEVLLLDPYFTAVDVATYENGTYPGVNRHHGVLTGESMERELPLDTNDCVVDFREQTAPTPGAPWLPAVAAPISNGGALSFTLSPNPMRAETTVSFELKKPGRASVAVYDVQGRLVQMLEDRELPAGVHALQWDGSSESGARASSGVYVIRLMSPEGAMTRRVALIH